MSHDLSLFLNANISFNPKVEEHWCHLNKICFNKFCSMDYEQHVPINYLFSLRYIQQVLLRMSFTFEQHVAFN